MKILSVFAVLALTASVNAWTPCPDWCLSKHGGAGELRPMADFVVEVNWDGNTTPGHRSHSANSCHTADAPVGVTNLQFGNRNGDVWHVSVDMGPDQRGSAWLALSVDDNLLECAFNGVLLEIVPHGWAGCWNGQCDDANEFAIPDGLWNLAGPNELECILSNSGGPGAFGVNMCSIAPGSPQVANPSDPECRQVVFNDEDEMYHLVPRDGTNSTGCLTDEECTTYTNADSWCKADGTCAGCNDWEGCCDLLPTEPVRPGDPEVLNPSDPACRQVYQGEDGLNHLVTRENGVMGCVSDEECIEHTGLSSWCKDDGTCRGCDDWEGCCVLEQ